MLLVIYLAPFMIDVLQIAFIFEMEMPRNKNILFFKLPFAYTLLTFYILLKGPDIN